MYVQVQVRIMSSSVKKTRTCDPHHSPSVVALTFGIPTGGRAARCERQLARHNWLMPGFHHSVAVSPFRCAVCDVPLYRCRIVPFRSCRCSCAWERNWCKRLSVFIGMNWPERWLAVYLRQHAKIGFDPIATERWLRRNGRRQRHNGIFHV